MSGCLHDADPLTTQLTTAQAASYPPGLDCLNTHYHDYLRGSCPPGARNDCLGEKGGDGDLIAGPALLVLPRAFPWQSGDYWGGRDNLYFITGRGGGMVHLIIMTRDSPLSTYVPRMKGGRGFSKLDQSSRRQSSSPSSLSLRVAMALKSPTCALLVGVELNGLNGSLDSLTAAWGTWSCSGTRKRRISALDWLEI